MCLRPCGSVAFGHMLQNRVALCLSLRPVSLTAQSMHQKKNQVMFLLFWVRFFAIPLHSSQSWGSYVEEPVIGATSSLQAKDKGHRRVCHQYTVKSWFPWVHAWLEPITRAPLIHLPGVYSTDIEEQKVLSPPGAVHAGSTAGWHGLC